MTVSVQDPRKCPAPQEFSGASIGGPSVHEEYQQAQDTLTNVNLPKLAHNLCPLEVAFTTCMEGKKRQKTTSWSNFTLSLPPTSTIEEVDNEDTISLGSDIGIIMEDIWDSVDDHLSLDMMDPIIFGTFNEFGIKNRSVFSPQNCLHDAKVSLPEPSTKRLQEVEILPNYEAYVNIIRDHMSQENKTPLCTSLNCEKCNSCSPGAPWLMDSGASKHFTMNMDEFHSYESIPANSKNKVITANGKTFIEGKGTVFLQHNVERNGWVIEQWTTCLSPIYYIPGLSSQLMSMGEFLHSGLKVQGSTESLELIEKCGKIAMQCLPVQRSDTIYWVKTQTVMPSKANVATIHVADYDIWHKWLGHVSPKVLSKSTQKFPRVQTPKFIPICPGCAEGKMKSWSFPESQSHATRLFELVHSDLKSLPVESYHRFKYFIVFTDDKSSHMWTANLRKKSDASKAIKNFEAMARIQHGATIKRWW